MDDNEDLYYSEDIPESRPSNKKIIFILLGVLILLIVLFIFYRSYKVYTSDVSKQIEILLGPKARLQYLKDQMSTDQGECKNFRLKKTRNVVYKYQKMILLDNSNADEKIKSGIINDNDIIPLVDSNGNPVFLKEEEMTEEQKAMLKKKIDEDTKTWSKTCNKGGIAALSIFSIITSIVVAYFMFFTRIGKTMTGKFSNFTEDNFSRMGNKNKYADVYKTSIDLAHSIADIKKLPRDFLDKPYTIDKNSSLIEESNLTLEQRNITYEDYLVLNNTVEAKKVLLEKTIELTGNKYSETFEEYNTGVRKATTEFLKTNRIKIGDKNKLTSGSYKKYIENINKLHADAITKIKIV